QWWVRPLHGDGTVGGAWSAALVFQARAPEGTTSYEASITSNYIDLNNQNAYAFADFNGDGRQDLLMAYISGNTGTVPIKMFLQSADGKFIEDESLLPSPVPGTIHARKIIIADFNNDGVPDAFIVDHGYDQPPFPGSKPLLLLSSHGKYVVKDLPDVP